MYSYLTIANRFTPQKDSQTTFYSSMGSTLKATGSASITYDSLGYPVLLKNYSQTVTPPSLVGFQRYYYEPVAVTVGAAALELKQFNITTSPNPTTGPITLHYPSAVAGASVSIRITNAAGQLVHAESLVLQGSGQQILLGDEAVPGLYYLSVYDRNENVIGSAKVEKR